MPNLRFTFKQGEVGKEMPFTLSDDNGVVDLSSWTVTLAIAENKSMAAVLTGLTVTKRTQTGATIGQCYHNLTDTVGLVTGSAQLPPKEYKACELKLVNGSQVRYWPVNENNERTYFVMECQKAMS